MLKVYHNGSKEHRARHNYEIMKDKFNEFTRDYLCKEGINPVLLPEEYGIEILPNTSTRLYIA